MAELEAPQSLEIENATSGVLEIMVEIYPDRYVLQPGDKMVIEAVLGFSPFVVNPFDGGMQIYPGNCVNDAIVSINGVVVEPDWSTGMTKR